MPIAFVIPLLPIRRKKCTGVARLLHDSSITGPPIMAMNVGVGGGLAAVLGEVWTSPLPLGERRRLAARVGVAAVER